MKHMKQFNQNFVKIMVSCTTRLFCMLRNKHSKSPNFNRIQNNGHFTKMMMIMPHSVRNRITSLSPISHDRIIVITHLICVRETSLKCLSRHVHLWWGQSTCKKVTAISKYGQKVNKSTVLCNDTRFANVRFFP